MNPKHESTYTESLTSPRTLLLFLALTLVFTMLTLWRILAARFDLLAGVLLFFALFFLFYTLNYRTLVICLTPESLKLTFGIFSWTIPLENVADCRLDEVAAVKRYGGAGIHFMFVDSRYRASYNFLEHPRVVIRLKEKSGRVQDLSFSTRQPEDVLRLMRCTPTQT